MTKYYVIGKLIVCSRNCDTNTQPKEEVVYEAGNNRTAKQLAYCLSTGYITENELLESVIESME